MSALSDADLAHRWRGRSVEPPLRVVVPPADSVGRWARVQPDATYLSAVDAKGDVQSLTFGQLELLTSRFRTWLTHTGTPSTSPVALLPRHDLASVVAIMGVLSAARPLLLLSPDDPAPRVQQQISTVGASLTMRAVGAAEHVNVARLIPGLGELADLVPSPAPPVDPLSVAFYFGTSGSTATSKLVAQTHYATAVNAHAVVIHHDLQPSEVFLGCLPIHHVNGLHFSLLANLVAGSHVVLASGFSPFDYPRLVERFRPRRASVVPSILEALLSSWRRPTLPTGLEYVVTAAAPLAASTARSFRRSFGCRVVQGYGLTETINFSTTVPPRLPSVAYDRLTIDCEVPSVGVALFGNDVTVCDGDGQLLPPGEIGEVCMRGHNVMAGYVGNEVATAEAFRGGWFHSGDLGFEVVEPDSGQSFFVITGRAKNVAKVRGESVSLEELERALRSLPHITDAAAVAVPDRLTGETILAAIVTDDSVGPTIGGSDTIIGSARKHLGNVLPPAAIPTRLVHLDAIPRTATGKVLRPQLAELLTGARPGAAP